MDGFKMIILRWGIDIINNLTVKIAKEGDSVLGCNWNNIIKGLIIAQMVAVW